MDVAKKMTHRERFRRLMHYQTVDRGVHHEFGFLKETWERWHNEGLPAQYSDIPSIEGYFGRDPVAMVPVSFGINPPFESKVLEEKPDSIVKQTSDGAIVEVQRRGQQTIPHYVKYPIESRKDWEAFKERYNPADPIRYHDYRGMAARFNAMDVPVGINAGSYLGWIRNWVGFERVAIWAYDERELLAEMVEHLADLFYKMLEPALKYIEVDFAHGWEDICFNSGPVIGPNIFREIVLPPMRRVMRLLRQHGVDVIATDCDGNIWALAPLWLEVGLNAMFPCEVNAGSDPVELRRKFGRDMLLYGGVAKKAIAGTKQEILDEMAKLAPVVADGGFIPMIDHRCPEYVSYDNYRFYQREKLAMLGFTQEEVDEIEPLRGMKATTPCAGGLIGG